MRVKPTVTPSNGNIKTPLSHTTQDPTRIVTSLTSPAVCRHWDPPGLRSQPLGSAEQAAPRTVALCHDVVSQCVTCKQNVHCYSHRSRYTSQLSCSTNGTQFH